MKQSSTTLLQRHLLVCFFLWLLQEKLAPAIDDGGTCSRTGRQAILFTVTSRMIHNTIIKDVTIYAIMGPASPPCSFDKRAHITQPPLSGPRLSCPLNYG
ncbi:hypothetical protein CIPAW_03G263200 [Carya illinoinensis]|uniref:Secreted protein n=1 Tax=Carya illinoinensis TaxID=32201 RepID=A0A8T1R7U5_CARIL|nr:hypothetical protein CIPAW_03G263200 [Carya illinoinensis]